MSGGRVFVAGCAGALLMLTAACGTGPEETASPDPENVEWAEGSEPIVAGDGDEGTDDREIADPGDKDATPGGDVEEPEGGQDDAEDAEASDDSSSAAADVVAPAEDFDPCAALPATEASAVVGTELEEREGVTAPFGIVCGYDASDSSAAVDLVWYTGDSSAEEMLEANVADWTIEDKLRDLAIPGAATAQAVVGQRGGTDGALVVAQVDGGVVVASITTDGTTVEDVTALVESVLSGV